MGLKTRTKPQSPPTRNLHPLVERMEPDQRYRLAELKELARALNPDIPNARFRSLVGALTEEGQLVKTGQRAAARWLRS